MRDYKQKTDQIDDLLGKMESELMMEREFESVEKERNKCEPIK